MSSKTDLLFMKISTVQSVKDWQKQSSVGTSKTLEMPLRYMDSFFDTLLKPHSFGTILQ